MYTGDPECGVEILFVTISNSESLKIHPFPVYVQGNNIHKHTLVWKENLIICDVKIIDIEGIMQNQAKCSDDLKFIKLPNYFHGWMRMFKL